MALTRKFLSALGIEAEKVDEIINAHSETVNALKEERDNYKTEAEKVPGLQKELDTAKQGAQDDSVWETKYNDEHLAFEKYKEEIANKERNQSMMDLYKQLLLDNGVDNKYVSSILNVTDVATLEMKDGKLVDESKLIADIKEKYSGFITSSSQQGANTETPPDGGEAMTKEAFEKLPLNEQMVYANEHPSEVSQFM